VDEFDDRLADCRQRLIAFARRRLPRTEQGWGSDYVQDSLLEAQQRAEVVRLLTPETTYLWLLGVLKRKMANGFRARRQAKRDPSRETRIDARTSEAILDQAVCPVETAIFHELSAFLDAAIGTLTPRQRKVVILHYYGMWTLEEIAKEIGISRQSVLNLMRRGLSRMEMNGVLRAFDFA
jgi:RNA polymerase sigma factor (sigma-70 family)